MKTIYGAVMASVVWSHFFCCGDRCMRRWVVSAEQHPLRSPGREFMVSAFWGGGSNARPRMVWARGMLGERVYGVSLFPLDKQNVTIGGLLNLRWTNRSIRDPFSRYALTFFEHMYTYETIHGHVGYSCLLLDTLNLPRSKAPPVGPDGSTCGAHWPSSWLPLPFLAGPH